MGKNDDLFEVDLGNSGVTLMEQSGVSQTDTQTVDNKPPVEQTPKNNNEFELVENLFDEPSEDQNEPEETDEDSTKKTKSPSPVKETNEASGSFAFVFAKYQQEEGNLSFELDEKELQEIIERSGEAAAMTYLFDKEADFRSTQLRELYDADAKEFISLRDAGVDSTVARELVGAKVKFENITEDQLEEKEELRRQVITQDLKNTTSLSDDRIKKLVDRAVATGDDIDEAKKALPNIQKFNTDQIKLEKKKVEDEEKAQVESAKASKEALIKRIDDTKEILPGYEVSKQIKKDIEKMITEPAAKTKDGRVLNGVWAKFQEDPENSLIKLAFLMRSGIWDGNLTKLEKKAATDTAKRMEDVIKSKGGSLGNKGKGTASADEGDSLQSMKDIFKV